MYRFSAIAAPLEDITKHEKLQWSSDADAAFAQLKNALTTTLVMAILDPSLPFEVMTDASDQAWCSNADESSYYL